MRVLALAAALAMAMLTGAATPAVADPWKDESGHGRWRYERGDGPRGRDHWRERRAYRYYGERPHRRAYRERRYYPAYGYYRERPRRVYRKRYNPAYGHYRRRAAPGVVIRFGPMPAYGYYR
jgi:hypothetical protein